MDERQRRALGRVAGPGRAFSGCGFDPLPEPGPNDWLTVHPEPGQSYDEYVASDPPAVSASRRVLALMPLGELAPNAVAPARLGRYAEAFFGLPTRLLAPATVETTGAHLRVRGGRRQLRTPDLLDFLRTRLPSDAFALAGFTTEDLYPEESWNFVFGQASLKDRVGVLSFARYDPAFYGEPRGPGHAGDMLRRSVNVLSHEVSHMFGLAHCAYFACLMNGLNHLAEADRRPFHVCPICLRKLQHAAPFDIAARYRALLSFYRDERFAAEASWVEQRLLALET